MTTYTISIKQHSQLAGRLRGHPYVWKEHWRFRGRFPSSEFEFHDWLYGIISSHGYPNGTVKIIRNQAKGESAGFKCVFYGFVDDRHVEVLRVGERSYGGSSGHVHKAIPGMPWNRQPWYQQNQFAERSRFKGSRSWGQPRPDGRYRVR